MPLYVHEVDARVTPEPPAGGDHGLSPEKFAALVSAVARELVRRQKDAEAVKADARITGTNRPPSVGG